MWQTDWAQTPPDGGLAAPPGVVSELEPTAVEQAAMLLWMEHCVECAIPDCYAVCPLFVARSDQKCARFRYGIFPNPNFHGLFPYGAEVHFRRWGKLETKLGFSAASPEEILRSAGRDAKALAVLKPVSTLLQGISPKRRLNGAYHFAREHSLRSRHAEPVQFDEFVVEVFNPQDGLVTLILEALPHKDAPIASRESLPLQPGLNHFRFPVAKLGVDPTAPGGYIRLYPDNDAEPRLVFTWLDLVRLRAPASLESKAVEAAQPAKTVKCVAWDLDNTLWEGILVEDGPDKLVPRAEAIALIHQLDERGIIQTVLSKNDHGPAMEVITHLGLQDYFISPAINWGQKSLNLKAIADELNINIDTFAVVDDSPFERREIGEAWPQVRVFPETDLARLLERPEFNVPITEETRQRRFSYLAEGKRKEIAQSYGDNYDDFLRSCEMTAHLFRPTSDAAIERCLELIQRSNQLNLSTRRYERAEFDALLADESILPVALACKDRFGEYGTVGFASIETGSTAPMLRDLVISCRIAKKKVEHAWFQWVAERLAEQGATQLDAAYRATSRNGVLRDTLVEMGFVPAGNREGGELLTLSFSRPIEGSEIVSVTHEGLATVQPEPVPAE